jgi:hypothetical protein
VLFVNVAIFSLVGALSVCRNELQRDSAVCEAGHWYAHLGDRRQVQGCLALAFDSSVAENVYHGNGTKLHAYSAQTRRKAMDTAVTQNNLIAHVRYP